MVNGTSSGLALPSVTLGSRQAVGEGKRREKEQGFNFRRQGWGGREQKGWWNQILSERVADCSPNPQPLLEY